MKYLYTATRLSHICQFHLPYLKMLKELGHTVHVAAMNNLCEKNGLKLKYVDKHIEIPFERFPYDPRNIVAYKNLKLLLAREHYDVIVCNTPVGGILTRFAARNYRKNGARVIYIAHGFHFYNGASIKNWVLYYPLEKTMARFCDAVVTINEEDYLLAKRSFPGEVARIHGVGVSTERYHPATPKEQANMRCSEGLSDEDFVVLCTGELNENKNQKTLISAAAQLKDKIPNLKVLLAGNGPKERELRAQITAEHLEGVVKFLGYRTDLERIVPAVDVVVSCSKREGLGLNVVEAMLCKKPVVAATNRGHAELVDNAVTGFLVDPDKVDDYVSCILKLYKSPSTRQLMGEASFWKAQTYTVESVAREVSSILTC